MPNTTLIIIILLVVGFLLFIHYFRKIIRWASKRDVESLVKRVSEADTLQRPYDEKDDYHDPAVDRDLTAHEKLLIFLLVACVFVAGLILELPSV